MLDTTAPTQLADAGAGTNGSGDKDKIRAFLARYVRQPLADDEDIFASGFVNSLLAMQLVAFVERDFAVSITDEDLDLDNFRSVAAIAALVERKRSAGAGG